MSERYEESSEEYQYPEWDERKQGISIEALQGWFPKTTLSGRLPESVLDRLWEKYPEPREEVLKTSAIDIDVSDAVPQHDMARDAGVRKQARDFANACRPIIHLALGIQKDTGIPQDTKSHILRCLKDTIFLYNHAAAVVEEDRRNHVAKAINWPDSLIAECRVVHSEDRANLFGKQIIKDHRRWCQERLAERAIRAQENAAKEIARAISGIRVNEPTKSTGPKRGTKSESEPEPQEPSPKEPRGSQ